MFGENRKKFDIKIATLLVIVIFFSSFSPMFARKAEAFIFTDWVNFAVNAITSFGVNSLWIKEYALDAVAYKVLDLVIQKMTASTVNWINSGFKGSPAFITDPEAYFQELGDGIAGNYIFKNPNLNFLCGPISARIKIALASNYRGGDINWQCTLSDVSGNMEDFMNDFDKGGWDKFFRLTQDSQNNPIGAYIQAEGELARQIAKKTDEKNRELSWGKGFFSAKKCERYGPDILDEVTGETLKGACIKEGIETPGAVIEGQLGEVLSIGGKKLAVADELNEILSALLNQLVGKVIGGIGGGLRGLSNPDPINNNQAFTNQLQNASNDAVIENYFSQSNTTISETINQGTENIGNINACRDNPNLPECLPPAGDPNNNGQIIVCDPSVQNCDSVTVSGSRSR